MIKAHAHVLALNSVLSQFILLNWGCCCFVLSYL